MQNSNPISIFVGRDQKTSTIRKNRLFRIIENIEYRTTAGFISGSLRWDSLSAFGASLRSTLHAIGALIHTALLWSGKINKVPPFCGRR